MPDAPKAEELDPPRCGKQIHRPSQMAAKSSFLARPVEARDGVVEDLGGDGFPVVRPWRAPSA